MSARLHPLHPLLVRALHSLQGLQRVPRQAEDSADHGLLVDEVSGALLSQDVAAGADLGINVWGSAAYVAAARTAIRVSSVAVTGDEAVGGASSLSR